MIIRRNLQLKKKYDSEGLRYVEPAGLGVEFGFRGFVWNAEENSDGGFVFNTKRGDEKWASVFVEQVEVVNEDGLHLIMSNYLEALDDIDDLSVVNRGARKVHGTQAAWAQYSGVSEGIRGYWYSTTFMYQGKLVTLHTWSLEPEWELLDDTAEEFLSNVR